MVIIMRDCEIDWCTSLYGGKGNERTSPKNFRAMFSHIVM